MKTAADGLQRRGEIFGAGQARVERIRERRKAALAETEARIEVLELRARLLKNQILHG
ncbi:hypothetical protein JWG42_05190 [Desulfoprunum benzoelyticum]|uniref:Uncharacterized protein n=1 Tax=Desulfoprunum benzoelyticum TaxID=1506996 RepID=A0A840V322_9BACT|nr:hypothetical protein [Desulfoprunum benzoelyticum]MBB5348260.1 hypothetical protein [Desulfoprunum benzoelyticum]MBM9529547.1 hypothetical protein [Desulfoprunum benzoelyticum]